MRERGRGVPARSAPPPLTDHVIEKGHRRRPSFDEHIRPIDAEAAATAVAPPEPTPDLPEGLAEILDALQQSFVQIAYLLRHGLRSEEDLPGSSSSTSLPESLVTGRSAGEVTILQAMADAAAARSKPGFRSRGLHGRTTATRETIRGMRQDETWQREVLMHDQRAAGILLEALASTGRVCAVALETHEGVVDLSEFLEPFEEEEDDEEAAVAQKPKHNEVAASAAATVVAPAPPANDPYSYYTRPTVAADPYSYYTRPSAPAAPTSAASSSPSTDAGRQKPRKRRPARFAVVLDPLSGAHLADAGVSVGTIFGIFRALDHECSPSAHVMRPGSKMIAAGYALYGASTQLVLSCGHGVDGFTLQPETELFLLTRPHLAMPPSGRFYSVNLGHKKNWSLAVQSRNHRSGSKPRTSRAPQARASSASCCLRCAAAMHALTSALLEPLA